MNHFIRSCITCLFVIVLLHSTAAAVARDDFTLFVEPLLGIRYGILGEYVYTKDVHGKQSKLSELDWDMKPLFYGNMGALFSYKAFHFDSRFRLYFENGCGSMNDSDWMNITIPNTPNIKTNYSKSDNLLRFGMQLDFTASWCIDIMPKTFSMSPFIAFEWERFDFRAQDGHGVYKDANTLASNGGKPKEYKAGELCGIDYMRSTMLGWIGAEVVYHPFSRCALSLALAISPYTYNESLDIHHAPEGQRERRYIDKADGWFSVYRFSTGVSFCVSERTTVMLNVMGTFSSELKGDTYSKVAGGGFEQDKASSARADINCVDISFGARYRFIP